MSIKDMKHRINSVKNIRQITKAVGLVSSTRLQRMRTKFESSRQFFSQIENLNVSSKFFCQPKSKRCVILVASDKGLCGSYNLNIGRFAVDLYREKENSALMIIGSSGAEIVHRNNIAPDRIFTGVDENSVSEIADAAISFYHNDYEIYLTYTKFYSAVKTVPTCKKILPMKKSNVIFEPDEKTVVDFFVPNYVRAAISSAILEASVCEQSTRMMNMNAATENANEMINNLVLKYNRLRQNQITQELTEIIGGADALND